MNSSSQETGLHVNRSVVLPLWEPNEACKNLFRVAVDAGELLGTELDASVAGNGSIGNITGAMGVATLDGLGACGSDVYGLQSNRTRSEYVEIDSLVQRARLIAALLSALK